MFACRGREMGQAMKPRERRESGQQDLFKARLDQIIDLGHALAKLAHLIDWHFLEGRFGAAYTDGPGSPPLPTRLMAGVEILKYSYGLSDERVCEQWVENPYFQYFCGEEKLVALLQESLAVAVKSEAMKPSELAGVIVDTAVQPKNVAFGPLPNLPSPEDRVFRLLRDWRAACRIAIDERYRGFVADRAMRSDLVVVSTPVLQFLPGVIQRQEPMCV